MKDLYFTKQADCLNMPATTLISAEIRRPHSVQNLIIKGIGGRLSIFTLRDKDNLANTGEIDLEGS